MVLAEHDRVGLRVWRVPRRASRPGGSRPGSEGSYLGFSSGAMVSAARALIGGWRDNGRAVCGEAWSEGLDELTTEAGLALVDFTIDVHATQGGFLSRAVSVGCRSRVERVVAIDERTCLSVPLNSRMDDGWQVSGTGFVWDIEAGSSHSPVVRRLPH